jgi:hypothetical protein
MSRRVAWMILPLGILAALVYFSSHLAALRIYQVDECQNLYMARTLATGHSSEFFTNASLFLLGPLSWIARSATRSADAFQMARLIFLGVFWLNLLLMALIAGERLYSLKTLLALVVAATLTPLWDYGFEVRHDNLVLTGVLLTWWVVRVKPMGAVSYVVAGATAVTLLFIAVKAVVYILPLSLAILAFPPPTFALSRVRRALAWVAGAVVATVLIRICYGTGGGWDIYLSVFHGVAKYSTGGGGGSPGFAPWTTLGRLPGQTPLLLGVTAAACVGVVVDFIRRSWAAVGWDGYLPEFLLVLGALAALAINPTPFPYNLVHVVPYAFVFAFRYIAGIWNEIWSPVKLRPLLAGTLVFTHLIPFGMATTRHWDHLNWRQEKLMNLAEDLTDPSCDPVYDGIGMVPTRPTIHFQWYLHSLNIQSFLNGKGPRVSDMLAGRPAAVFIPSYRTDWLSDADHDFIRERYVSLADDFWVLGKVLSAGGGTFEIVHPGRYRISTLKGSDLADTYPLGMKGIMTLEDAGTLTGTLDGKPLTNRPVQLSAGVHRIECAPDCQPAVVWMGPRLDRVHRIGPGDHRVLFYNWY